MSIVPNRSLAGAGGNQGYNIQRSLRFRASASAYLNRTPASAGNRKTYTWSGWLKRGVMSAYSGIFGAWYGAGTGNNTIHFTNTDNIRFYDYTGLGFNYDLVTTQVFRDPSAWYHLVVAVDTTQATASNRIKIYINGSQVTSFSTSDYPAQNSEAYINTTNAHYISYFAGFGYYFDGYQAEVNFIDGQALTPSSFGQTDPVTGAWIPKRYGGSYGTNGFYLPFTNTTSATTLAYDASGNGNNWTPNNISTTAGATYDSMTDVPTLTSATASNYAVLNPLVRQPGKTYGTITNGNLTATATSAGDNLDAFGSILITTSTPKCYWEIKNDVTASAGNYPLSGLENANNIYTQNAWFLTSGQGVGFYASGPVYNGGTLVGSYTAPNTGTIGFAYDPSNGKLWMSVNGSWITGDPAAGTSPVVTLATTNDWFPVTSNLVNSVSNVNFGQQPFSYTPPTGFVALNAFNLPTPTIKNGTAYTDSTKYTGNSSTNSVTNAYGFQPGLVWVKSYTDASSQCWVDSVRGTNAYIFSNQTVAEETATNALTAFNSNGFTLGANNTGTYTSGNMNYNGSGYVAWQWKESATAGFDIVTYTGTGSAQNIAHNLGVAPAFIIVKGRNVGSTNWFMYHQSLGATKYVDFSTGTGGTDSSAWNNTAPTSSVFTVGSSYYTNYSGTTYVAYVWAQIPGFSSFGTYVGNYDNNGPFAYTGFKVKWLMIKNITTGSTSWFNEDGARDPYNAVYKELSPNNPNAQDNIDDIFFDFLSNGFKARNQSYGNNGPSNTYLYAAFAECPFKYANAR